MRGIGIGFQEIYEIPVKGRDLACGSVTGGV
jgi:hypothetical protein